MLYLKIHKNNKYLAKSINFHFNSQVRLLYPLKYLNFPVQKQKGKKFQVNKDMQNLSNFLLLLILQILPVEGCSKHLAKFQI